METLLQTLDGLGFGRFMALPLEGCVKDQIGNPLRNGFIALNCGDSSFLENTFIEL